MTTPDELAAIRRRWATLQIKNDTSLAHDLRRDLYFALNAYDTVSQYYAGLRTTMKGVTAERDAAIRERDEAKAWGMKAAKWDCTEEFERLRNDNGDLRQQRDAALARVRELEERAMVLAQQWTTGNLATKERIAELEAAIAVHRESPYPADARLYAVLEPGYASPLDAAQRRVAELEASLRAFTDMWEWRFDGHNEPAYVMREYDSGKMFNAISRARRLLTGSDAPAHAVSPTCKAEDAAPVEETLGGEGKESC